MGKFSDHYRSVRYYKFLFSLTLLLSFFLKLLCKVRDFNLKCGWGHVICSIGLHLSRTCLSAKSRWLSHAWKDKVWMRSCNLQLWTPSLLNVSFCQDSRWLSHACKDSWNFTDKFLFIFACLQRALWYSLTISNWYYKHMT